MGDIASIERKSPGDRSFRGFAVSGGGLFAQLEAYAQDAVLPFFAGLPFVGDPDEVAAFRGAGDVLADAGAGVEHAFGLVRVADIDDAQGVARAFRQAGEIEAGGGFFARHLAGHDGQVGLDDVVHFGGDAGGFLGGKVVREAEVHLALVGVDVRGKTAGAAVAADEHAGEGVFGAVHARIVFFSHEGLLFCDGPEG